MHGSSEDIRSTLGDLRLNRSSSPATSGSSSQSSDSRSVESWPCTIDGAVLLETEQVLSGLAPRLLRYTDRIRKEGWIRPMRSEATRSFRKYAIIVPIAAVREILAALERASAVYYPHHLPMMRLVEHWREIYGTYP